MAGQHMAHLMHGSPALDAADKPAIQPNGCGKLHQPAQLHVRRILKHPGQILVDGLYHPNLHVVLKLDIAKGCLITEEKGLRHMTDGINSAAGCLVCRQRGCQLRVQDGYFWIQAAGRPHVAFALRPIIRYDSGGIHLTGCGWKGGNHDHWKRLPGRDLIVFGMGKTDHLPDVLIRVQDSRGNDLGQIHGAAPSHANDHVHLLFPAKVYPVSGFTDFRVGSGDETIHVVNPAFL